MLWVSSYMSFWFLDSQTIIFLASSIYIVLGARDEFFFTNKRCKCIRAWMILLREFSYLVSEKGHVCLGPVGSHRPCRANVGLRSIKCIGVFLIPPPRDAGLSSTISLALNLFACTHLHTWGGEEQNIMIPDGTRIQTGCLIRSSAR